jgi:hypothetical protein
MLSTVVSTGTAAARTICANFDPVIHVASPLALFLVVGQLAVQPFQRGLGRAIPSLCVTADMAAFPPSQPICRSLFH